MKERKLKIGLALVAALALVFAAGCSDGGDTINNYYEEVSGSSWDNSAAYAGKTYAYTANAEHGTSATSGTVLGASLAFADDGTVTLTASMYEHATSGTFSLGAGGTAGSGLEACAFDETASDGYCGVYSGSVTGTYFTSTSDTAEYVIVILPADSEGNSSCAFHFCRSDAGGSLYFSQGDWTSDYTLGLALVASSTGATAGTGALGNSTSAGLYYGGYLVDGWSSVNFTLVSE